MQWGALIRALFSIYKRFALWFQEFLVQFESSSSSSKVFSSFKKEDYQVILDFLYSQLGEFIQSANQPELTRNFVFSSTSTFGFVKSKIPEQKLSTFLWPVLPYYDQMINDRQSNHDLVSWIVVKS